MDLSRFENLSNPDCLRQKIFGNDFENLFVVGMVAAFEERKDHFTAVKAAVTLASRIENIRFVFVGGGEYLNSIKKSVPEEFLDKIIFLGKRSDVEDIVNIFDIAILLTNAKVHGEGISNSIIEYMALGKPVIATLGGGTNELIQNGQNGFLILPHDESDLIEKIEFLRNDENRSKIGKKGRETVQKKFDLKIMASLYSNLYENLLKKSSK
jgi:glycosyltransferase involved in cell wall biosynthesis